MSKVWQSMLVDHHIEMLGTDGAGQTINCCKQGQGVVFTGESLQGV